MHINELDNYDLKDAIRFHSRLNPGLWNNREHIKPEVRAALLKIAADFQEFLGVPDLQVKDITVSGSNAAYTYTPHSDIDLHLVVDIPDLYDPVYKELFNAKKYQYNNQNSIKVRDFDVELYVQPADESVISQGEYSLKNDRWIQVPRRKRADINDSAVRNKYEDLKQRIEQTVETGSGAEPLMKKIRAMRQAGLDEHGEFSAENLAFKMLRSQGYIERLAQARSKEHSLELSLDERRKGKKKHRRKTYGYGGYWFPGFAYAGQDHPAGSENSDGDDSGGGESMHEGFADSLYKSARTAAMAGAMTMSPAAAQTQPPAAEPITIAYVTINGETKKFDLGTRFKTAKQAEKFVSDVLDRQGLEGTYDIEIKRGYPKQSTQEDVGHTWDGVSPSTTMFASEDVGHTWDGVSPSTTMFTSEDQTDRTDIINYFAQHCAKYLKLQQLPKIEIIRGTEWSAKNGSFGRYVPEDNTLSLAIDGRHIVDVLRTLAHELTHAHQDQHNELDQDSGETGSPEENEANAQAGILMRQFAEKHPEFFKDTAVKESLEVQLRRQLQSMKEASGYIPTRAQARDPRFSMALTVDIKPGELGRQANKLGLETDAQGRPALLMKSLAQQLREYKETPRKKSLVIFDIDDTLLHTTAKIRVVNRGRVVRELTNQQFNHYTLQPGEEFDFGEFRNAEKFNRESEPIKPMIRKLKTILSNSPDSDVIMLTARADFDNKELFLKTFRDLGIDMSRVHVRRAGNLPGDAIPAEKKAVWVRKYLNTDRYDHVRLYDDSMSNLTVFKDLRQEYPGVDFRAIYVGPKGTTQPIEEDYQYEKHRGKIQDFIQWVYDREHIKDPLPRITFASEKESADQHRTGYYDWHTNTMWIYTGHRNFIDILRTVAHELVHRKQGAQGRIKKKSPPGSKLEREADSEAGYLMKLYARHDPSIIDEHVNLDESADVDLFEVNMSPGNLRKMAAKTGAIAGIEFEMYVPGAASDDDDDDYDVEPDWDMDESFPTGRGWRQEVVEFFRGGDYSSPTSVINRALDRLDEDYWNWKEENFTAWLDDNYSVFWDFLKDELPQQDGESGEEYQERLLTVANETGGPEYERAMEQCQEEYQGIDQFESFLENEDINSMVDFHNQYEIDWPYMNYPESSGRIGIDDVASDFQAAIGRPVTTGTYHSGQRSQTNNYRIEGDSSLRDPADPDDGGLEFISPPLPIDEMISDLHKVVKWANRNDCYTNDSCGLHMNVSIPDYSRENLDYVKLAIFLGDEYVLNEFGRLGNTYCESALQKIKKIAQTQPDKMQTMLQMMQNNLSAMASKIVHTGATNKYTSINTQDGYIEFRSPGGDWLGEYAANESKIDNTLLRCAVALDIATKPELYRQEYMKKLYKVLTPTEFTPGKKGVKQTAVDKDVSEVNELLSKYISGMLPESAMLSFVRQMKLQRKAKKLDPAAAKGKALIQWKATSGASTTKVVATTQEEARKKAAIIMGIPSNDRAVGTMELEPLDLYTGPVKNYTITGDYNGSRLADVTGVDEADAVANFRLAKPQWDATDVTARLTNTEPSASSRDQEWTGVWEVVSRPTDEVVYTISGIGNWIVDAERYARIWATNTGFDDPIYVRPQMRSRAAGGFDRAPHSSTYQVINHRTGEVVRGGETISFAALGDRIRHAHAYQGGPDPYSGDLKIVDLNTNTVYNLDGSRFNPVLPGSTQDRINQRLAAQPDQLYNVRWTDENGEHDVNRRAPNANAAMEDVRNSLESSGFWVATIEANPVGQSQDSTPAQGTESLPPGNVRWLILDRNDQEIYSFINTTAQRDANLYASDWLSRNRETVSNRGPFEVVPAR